jgi:hypothetical protein
MNVSSVQIYAALLVAAFMAILGSNWRKLSSSYGYIYSHDNLVTTAVISVVIGVAATIAAPFFFPLPVWQYAAIIPVAVVAGVTIMTSAQLIAQMTVNFAVSTWNFVSSKLIGNNNVAEEATA